MVMRFDPFRELDRFSQQAWGGTGQSRSIPMDAYRRGDAVFLHFDIPGIAPGTIELTVEQNVLRLSAERSYDRREGDQIIAVERPSGLLERQVLLGEHLDPGSLKATYDLGVLTIEIPIAAQAKPRRIEIQAGEEGSEHQVIDVEQAT